MEESKERSLMHRGMREAENTNKKALPGIETQLSKLYQASTAAILSFSMPDLHGQIRSQ